MKVMGSHITIGSIELSYCHRVKVTSSWKALTDTASVWLPNLRSTLQEGIRSGDAVTIQLGYDGQLRTEFQGFVAEVVPTKPFEVRCEDAMWQLKQQQVNQSWASTTLEVVLRYLVGASASIDVPTIELKPFRLVNTTVYGALQKIKDEYGLAVYYRDGVLRCTLPYVEPSATQVAYDFQFNALQEGLVFRRADQVKVRIRAIGVRPDNTRITVEVGDTDGELHTLHYYDKSEAELRDLASRKLDTLRFDGYRGSFKAFGQPLVRHSDTAQLSDERYPERAGSFAIDSVTTEYGPSGFRRKVELGKSLAA